MDRDRLLKSHGIPCALNLGSHHHPTNGIGFTSLLHPRWYLGLLHVIPQLYMYMYMYM